MDRNLSAILLVDDDENDRVLVEIAFSQAGITNPLRMVSDGQEAIEYLSGNGRFANRISNPMPGFVLLDLNTPQMDGLEVLRWIRSKPELESLVVIMLTEETESWKARQAYQLGANSFAIKPYGQRTYSDLAQSFKGWWLETNLVP